MHGLCVHEEYDLLFFLGATAICNPVVSNTSAMKDEESLFLLFGKLFSTKLLSTKLLSAMGGVSSVVVVVIDVSESATLLLLPASGTGKVKLIGLGLGLGLGLIKLARASRFF